MPLINHIILGNYITLILIIFFYLLLFINNTVEKKIINRFKMVASVYFLLMCSDIIQYISTTKNSSFALKIRFITATNGYLLRTAVLMLILRIFWENYKKKYIYTPFLINLICLVINIFYPLMFRYENGRIVRKLFAYEPHVISAFYIIMMICIAIKRFKVVNKKEKTIFIFTGVSIAGAVAIETILKYYFVLNSVALCSIIFYYLYLYDNICKVDNITGLYTRRTFFSNLKEYSKNSFVIVNIDVNNFKKINDTFGHLAGDKALKEISSLILKGLLVRCTLYRVGGDEFIIICPKYKISDIEVMMQEISLLIEEKNYSIAYGISLYEKSMEFEKVLKTSDDLMYAKKRQMKQDIFFHNQ